MGHRLKDSRPQVSSMTKWLRRRANPITEDSYKILIGEFPKIGVPYYGVLIIRILLFRVPF